MAPPQEAGANDSDIETTTHSVLDPKWMKMFPSRVQDSQDARRFITRAMFVAFSQFLKHRQILESNYFHMNYICEKVKASTLSFNNKESTEIARTIRSAGEAIKLGYLDELALVISQEDYEETALEVFSFKMHYDKNGIPSANVSTGSIGQNHEIARIEYEGTETVRRQLVKIVECIQLLCSKILKPLPEDYSANFRVAYVKETPASYRIPGIPDHSTFYKPHPDAKHTVLGHLRPNHYAGLIDCTSIFIESDEQTKRMIKREEERLAKMWNFDSNAAVYGTFLTVYSEEESMVMNIADQPIQNDSDPEDAPANNLQAANDTFALFDTTPQMISPKPAKEPTKSKKRVSIKSPPYSFNERRNSGPHYGRVRSLRNRPL